MWHTWSSQIAHDEEPSILDGNQFNVSRTTHTHTYIKVPIKRIRPNKHFTRHKSLYNSSFLFTFRARCHL